jgi:DNA-3-methyladenine glycosylase II
MRPRQLTHHTLRLGVRALCRNDRDLAAVVRRLGAPPLWGRRPGFPTLIRIVLEQQVSLHSARALYLRLQQSLGQVIPETVNRLGEAGLRRLGFTRQKAAYCHGLSCTILAGTLDMRAVGRADDVTAREALLAIHGVGPWTADIYLLMALRRPDVWPSGDLALAEAARQVKGLRARPSHAVLARMAEGWAPWRSVAARVLWHHYLSTR